MNIDHNLTTPVTVVVAACNRPDLLERTLDSFFVFNTYQHITKVIVVEDSAGWIILLAKRGLLFSERAASE